MTARYEIELETYSKQLKIEALTMLSMAKKDIIPSVSAYIKTLTDAVLSKKALSADIPSDAEQEIIVSLSEKLSKFAKKTAELQSTVDSASGEDSLQLALYYRNTVFEAMTELRAIGDSMEEETAKTYWPYPSYSEMLFGV